MPKILKIKLTLFKDYTYDINYYIKDILLILILLNVLDLSNFESYFDPMKYNSPKTDSFI